MSDQQEPRELELPPLYKRYQRESSIWPNLTGRMRTFEDDIGRKIWAIEVDIPITPQMREIFKEQNGLIVPRNITQLTYLELSPEESIPPSWRPYATAEEIENEPNVIIYTDLMRIVQPPGSASIDLKSLPSVLEKKSANQISFVLIHAGIDPRTSANQKIVNELNQILKRSSGNTIVIINGHGGPETLIYETGERRSRHRVGKKHGSSGTPGWGEVATQSVTDQYQDPQTAVMILRVCNSSNEPIKTTKVPIIYPTDNLGIQLVRPPGIAYSMKDATPSK